jgi:two-component sensor histidine kinase
MDDRGPRQHHSRCDRSIRQCGHPEILDRGTRNTDDVGSRDRDCDDAQRTLHQHHELCTNTTKFGALSVPTGRVEIAWALDPSGQRLNLTWTEKNGPEVRSPERRSFGTRLIETLGRQLKGDVVLTYEPAGFVYALNVPLASLVSTVSE